MKRAAITDINFGTAFNGVKHATIKKVLSPSAKYNRFLQKSQWWSESHLRQYQLQELQKMVRHAFKHVPYYRGVQQVFNVQAEDIQSIEDLQRIPFLEKDTVRRQYPDMISTAPNLSPLYKCYTSGTSGTPVTLFRNLKNVGFEYAMLSRQRVWAGIEPGELYATLKGEIIPKNLIEREIFWAHSPAEDKFIMSSYHLSQQTANRYIDALLNSGAQALDGYPSSIFALAKFILEQNATLPMKAVLTSSETLTPVQKSTIEQAFECKVFDYYGMAERIAAIHTCEHGHYHVVPEYSVVEYVRNSNLSGNYYEIVGTSLTNSAMPLLRYRIGDAVEVDDEKCECGREYPTVKRVIGRMDDYVVTPSGKMVGRLDHVFKGVSNVIQAQIYQPNRDNLILRIVPDTTFSASDGEKILEKLSKRVGEQMHFEIENVMSIPRTARGKLKSVVSDVQVFDSVYNEII